MERRRLARGGDPRDGGVPTQGTRRPRLAAASAALLLAGGLAVYASLRAGAEAAAGVGLVGGLGFGCVVVALLAVWDDGLVAGSALLLVAYTLSLVFRDSPLDLSASLVAVALLACVEIGAWSLELGDGAEELRTRLSRVFVLLVGALVASALLLAVGSIRADAGLALWALGAGAALALLAVVTRAARVGLGIEARAASQDGGSGAAGEGL